MKSTFAIRLFCLLAFPTVVNAQEHSLTREKAAKVIEQSEHMKAYGATEQHRYNTLELVRTAIQEGEVSGFWKYQQASPWERQFTEPVTGRRPVTGFLIFTVQGSNGPMTKISAQTMADGKKAIYLSDDSRTGKLWAINLRIEAPIPVTVTGITDAPASMTGKIVEFEPRFLVPTYLYKYTVNREIIGSKGEAHLKLYDDGWRVQDLKVDW